MVKKISAFVIPLFVMSASCLYGGKVDDAAKLLSINAWSNAVKYLEQAIPNAENQYLNVKDTLRPNKQKVKADEYCLLILFKGFAEMNIGALGNAEEDFKKVILFYDLNSTSQFLFKAYAWKSRKLIHRKVMNYFMDGFCNEMSKKAYNEYKNKKKKEDKYEQILEGIMGNLIF